jgi:hypothetical protein
MLRDLDESHRIAGAGSRVGEVVNPPPAGESCPHCGSRNLSRVECHGGPHHARLACGSCHRHLRFLPAPWSLQRARRFVMPYGRHRGSPIGDLADSATGRGYLRWLVENTDGNGATAARIVLEAAGRPEATGEGKDR